MVERMRRRTAERFLPRRPFPHTSLLPTHPRERDNRSGDFITRAGDPIESICFLEQGIAGVLDSLDDDRRYAVGLVGAKGFIGWPLVMGDDRSPYHVTMRAERGQALPMPAKALLAAVDQGPTLRLTLLRFAHVFMLQMGRTVVSPLAHSIERRMARRILLYHDRVQADEICMTHEEFRLMLGVRRSSVTDALHRLEEEHAIRAVRANVLVHDRTKLMALAAIHMANQSRTMSVSYRSTGNAKDPSELPVMGHSRPFLRPPTSDARSTPRRPLLAPATLS